MATADPDMEEMRIMSYEPRQRVCKLQNQVPSRYDYIDVMWCHDHLPNLPERWCTAKVLHIVQSPAQDAIASGVIRYIPDDAWDEEIHTVEFLTNHKLRRTAEEEEHDADIPTSVNANPITLWQFARNKNTSSEPSDNEDWEKPPSALVQRRMDRTNTRISEEYETRSLRTGYATLLVEVEKIKKHLVRNSHWMSQIGKSREELGSCSSAGCVLTRLRYRLGLRMQSALRTSSICAGKRANIDSEPNVSVRTGDGIHVAAIRTRVECTLDQFEAVAAHFKVSAEHDEVIFVPDFCHTQLPSQCSAAFGIYFTNATTFLSHIGVKSFSDVLEIVRKCGTGPQGDILRLLGTYEFDKDDESRSAIIHIGTSRDRRDGNTPNGADASSDEFIPGREYPVLTRKSRLWNKMDKRFAHPLNLRYRKGPALVVSDPGVKAFSLSWKRAAELGPRTWSRDMRDSTKVFGWLEANLPYIQVEGKHLCEEIGGIIPDDIWQKMFDSSTQTRS